MTIAWHDWCVKVPGRKNPKTRQKKILVAAIQRFSKFGYRRTSINMSPKKPDWRAPRSTCIDEEAGPFVAGLERLTRNLGSWPETAAAKKGSAEERILATVMAQYGATYDIVHGTASGHELFQANLQLGRAVSRMPAPWRETPDPPRAAGHSRREFNRAGPRSALQT